MGYVKGHFNSNENLSSSVFLAVELISFESRGTLFQNILRTFRFLYKIIGDLFKRMGDPPQEDVNFHGAKNFFQGDGGRRAHHHEGYGGYKMTPR